MTEKNGKNCIIVGGTSGIGAAFAEQLKTKYDHLYVIGLGEPSVTGDNIETIKLDLSKGDFTKFDEVVDKCNTLIVTAGIGRVDYFENLPEPEIKKTIQINFTSTITLIKRFYSKLQSEDEAYCLTMGSLAGEIASPKATTLSSSDLAPLTALPISCQFLSRARPSTAVKPTSTP